MKIKIIILYVMLSTGALVQLACKKFVQVDPPETQAELSKVFADDATAISATVGLYNQMVAGNLLFFNGAVTLFGGLMADEVANVGPNSTYDPFRTNSILADNATIVSFFWSGPFRNIYSSNAVLEGLEASSGLSPAMKDQLRGEMLYTRSLLYFYLCNLYGDFPLQTTTDYIQNAVMPRTVRTAIYERIATDLNEALGLLSSSYVGAVNTRPNRGSAAALLAKVYLYREDYVAAERMATEVIGSGRYSLESLANVFLATSKETIFQLSKQNSNTAEGAVFVPSSTTVRPTFMLTPILLNAFENGDMRKINWLKSNTVSGTIYYYPYKYKVRSGTTVTEYNIVQRLAEQYLIRAEARAQQGKLVSAIEDLDAIRARAGLRTIKVTNPGISKIDLIEAILRERQVELFIEWGNRWFDLKRTGKANATLGINKTPNWQSTDQLFPIPFSELQKNPFLTQNDGYLK